MHKPTKKTVEAHFNAGHVWSETYYCEGDDQSKLLSALRQRKPVALTVDGVDVLSTSRAKKKEPTSEENCSN